MLKGKVSVMSSAFMQLLAVFLSSVASPFIMVFQNLCFGVSDTVESHLIQNRFSNKERATMASIYSLSKTIIFALSSVLLGYITDIYGISFALILLGFIKIIPAIIIKFFYYDNEYGVV